MIQRGWRISRRLLSPSQKVHLAVGLAVGMTFGLAGSALAQSPAQPLGPEVQWKDPSSVRLEVDFPGNGYHASWQLFRCDCGDLLVRAELNEPGEVAHGDILLVSNRAVLSKGYEKNSEELLSFDAPALMMQLALRLLERSEPAGPSVVTSKQKAEVVDKINYINLDTGAAAGGFPAPWSVAGTLAPDGDTRRRFDLKFTFNTGGAAGGEAQQGEMRLKGLAEYAKSDFPVGNDLQLQDWLLSWRDPADPLNKAQAESSTKPANLGELRELIRKTPAAP